MYPDFFIHIMKGIVVRGLESLASETLLLLILYSQKLLPGENFCQLCHFALFGKFFSANFLSCVNDCIGDMATLPHWQKFISPNIYPVRMPKG